MATIVGDSKSKTSSPGRLRRLFAALVMGFTAITGYALHSHALSLQSDAVTRPFSEQIRLTAPWNQSAIVVLWLGTCASVLLGVGWRSRGARWFAGAVTAIYATLLVAGHIFNQRLMALPY